MSLEREFESKHLLNMQSGYNRLARMLKVNADFLGKEIHRLQTKRLLEPKKYGGQLKRNKALLKIINNNFDLLEKDLFSELNNQTSAQWSLANAKNTLLTEKFLGSVPVQFNKLNLDALEAFQKRNINGLNLSDRIHNLTATNKRLYQDYIGSGITQGKSADSIARQLNKINLDPKNVTVFDAAGNPTKLSKISSILQPNASGRGIYRSPLKNLNRMVRTETNAAYRLSDHERMLQLDFVVGYKVNLSGAHNIDDMCNFLAGDYPKTFKFSGWHPNCLCYVTSILKTKEEFIKGVKTSKNLVSKIPESAQRYVKTRGSKLASSDWYKDNFVTERKPYVATLVPKKQSKKSAKKWAQRERVSKEKLATNLNSIGEYNKANKLRELDFIRNVKL
jgi:hypothetical protein